MHIKQKIIRGIANLIFSTKKAEFAHTRLTFLVFTGTAGKTTTRDAVVYALKKLNIPVYSNHVGYTNELGVILSTLGYTTFSFKNPRAIFALFRKKVRQEGFICIELGADFYEDIHWFLKKFTPFAVFVSGVATESWSRDVEKINGERSSLIRSIPASGFVFYNKDDKSSRELVEKNSSVAEKVPYLPIDFNRFVFEPQMNAVRATRAFLQKVFPHHASKTADLFADYQFSHNRLQFHRAQNGATILEDSYKATPLCTEWFLRTSLKNPAHKRILVVTEMRPLTIQREHFYSALGALTKEFDICYFVGPKKYFDILKIKNPTAKLLDPKNYTEAAQEILRSSGPDDCIFLKGSFRYHLDSLRSLLT